MLDLIIYEDGKEVYRKENQELILSYNSTSNDWYIRGGASINDLIKLASDSLLFIYDTIKTSGESLNIFEFLNDVIESLQYTKHDENINSTILKCSNPKDLFNAIQTAMNLNSEVQNKLPDGYRFAGIDYDELLKQLGDDKDEENN